VNVLAHLLLAQRCHADLVGALLPDMGRTARSAIPSLPAHIRRSCALHLRIDAFVDRHPATAAARKCCRGARHFSGVAVDVLFDHCLASHWQEFHPEPLPRFIASCYDALDQASAIPAPLASRLAAWRPGRVLEDAATLVGIRASLARIANRSTRPLPVTSIMDTYQHAQADIETAFRFVWQDLVAFVPGEA
jgi:acyl carrier protein phosphodiesterase